MKSVIFSAILFLCCSAVVLSMPAANEDKERKLTIHIEHDEDGDCGCNKTQPNPAPQPQTTPYPIMTTAWWDWTSAGPSQDPQPTSASGCPLFDCCFFECQSGCAGYSNGVPLGCGWSAPPAEFCYYQNRQMPTECANLGCTPQDCGRDCNPNPTPQGIDVCNPLHL